MKNDEKYLRSKDVAWMLDCSPDDAIELARSGKLKATKEGRFWRYREADVMAYKRQNQESAQQHPPLPSEVIPQIMTQAPEVFL